MTDNEQARPIDTDILIGNMLHQAEAVIDIDEQSLERGKQQLLAQLALSTPKDSPYDENREAPPAASWRPDRNGERPLNEIVFLTVAEVASVMRVSKMTVYRLVHSGHLAAIRVGRSFRVPEQAVHEYLRENDMESIESTDRP